MNSLKVETKCKKIFVPFYFSVKKLRVLFSSLVEKNCKLHESADFFLQRHHMPGCISPDNCLGQSINSATTN